MLPIGHDTQRTPMQSLRVTFVLPGPARNPSGSHRVVYEYANRLARIGHSVTLAFASRVSGQASLQSATGAALRRVRRRLMPVRPMWFHLDPAVQLIRVPEISDAHVPSSDAVVGTWWLTAADIWRLGPQCGTKYLFAHHYEGDKYPRSMVDQCLRLPLRKVAVSHTTYKELISRGINDVVHIPNGIDSNTYQLHVPIRERYSGSIAFNFVPKASKDPATTVAAIASLRGTLRCLRVKAFGAVARPGLPDWIEYVYRPSTQELVKDIYNGSAIFVSSSIIEGFGLTQAEAMACGCALAATDSGGNREFAVPGHSSLLSDPQDIAGLAANVRTLITDPELRFGIVESARQIISRMSWLASVQRFEGDIRAQSQVGNGGEASG